MMPCLPKGFSIKFQRISFSFLSGHITLEDVEVITRDMAIKITKIFGNIYYWRKIPNFEANDKAKKNRCRITIYGLELTIFNRTWSTDQVAKILWMFKEGRSTKDVTEYIKSLYPLPETYRLSILYRMILPLEFHVYAASIFFGNPKLPAFLIFRAESMSGHYTILPRQSEAHSLRSIITIDMYTTVFKYMPGTIQETPEFLKSMRQIRERARKPGTIFRSENIEVEVLMDLPGMYVLRQDVNKPNHVTKEPELIVNLKMLGQTNLEYGPYTDKLRGAFMEFYAPFFFNDPIFYNVSNKAVKYWEVNLFLSEGTVWNMPFVTNEGRNEVLTLKMKGGSNFQIFVPNCVSRPAENKFECTGEIVNLEISSTILNTPVMITAEGMKIGCSQYYPEKWNGVTDMKVSILMENVDWLLHPYHIEYLTQLGTDWSSWYPFQKQEYTPNNFYPYNYIVDLAMTPVRIKMFSDWDPPYEFTENWSDHSRTDWETSGIRFRMLAPMVEFEEREKEVTFSCTIGESRISFIHPDGHIRQLRRGIRFYDYMIMKKLDLSGAYKWTHDPAGDVQLPVNIRIGKINGICTVNSLELLVQTLCNYTARPKKHPAEWNDPVPINSNEYKQHTKVTVSIDDGSIAVPIDLYDPKS